MKKYLLAILVLATVSVSSVGAEAADSVHEVGVALGTTSGPFSRARLTDGNFSFSLVGSYAYALSSMVQIGPEVTVSYTETLTVFDFMGSLTLNFGGENDTIQSAFYVKPSVGLELVSTTGNSATSFIWGGGVGKRFAIGSNVSYKPNLSALSVGGVLVLSLVPLEFSFFL